MILGDWSKIVLSPGCAAEGVWGPEGGAGDQGATPQWEGWRDQHPGGKAADLVGPGGQRRAGTASPANPGMYHTYSLAGMPVFIGNHFNRS